MYKGFQSAEKYYHMTQNIKNRFSQVAMNFQEIMDRGEEIEPDIKKRQFLLPTGKALELTYDLRIGPGELLFNPREISGDKFIPIQDQIQDSIDKTAKEF